MLGMDLDWTHAMVALISAVATLLLVAVMTFFLTKVSA